MRNGRLSSSSFAITTPAGSSSAGISWSEVTIGPMPSIGRGASSGSSRTAGPKARSAGSSVSSSGCAACRTAARSTSTERRAGAHSGRARRTSATRRPRPAPASTMTNGSGRPRSIHERSRKRATRAPNRVPTSGLVTKSRPARPAPPPRAKKPPSSSYRAMSTYRSKGTGPSRRMRSAMRSAGAATHASEASAREGDLADAGEQLRIDPDHDDDRGRDRQRDAEGGRRARRDLLDAGLGRVAEPHAANHTGVIEERDHRVHGGDHPERVRGGGTGVEDGAEHHELGEPARQGRDPGEGEQERRHQQRQHGRGL